MEREHAEFPNSSAGGRLLSEFSKMRSIGGGYFFDGLEHEGGVFLHDPVIAVAGQDMFAEREAPGDGCVLFLAAFWGGTGRQDEDRSFAEGRVLADL